MFRLYSQTKWDNFWTIDHILLYLGGSPYSFLTHSYVAFFAPVLATIYFTKRYSTSKAPGLSYTKYLALKLFLVTLVLPGIPIVWAFFLETVIRPDPSLAVVGLTSMIILSIAEVSLLIIVGNLVYKKFLRKR